MLALSVLAAAAPAAGAQDESRVVIAVLPYGASV
jgi:hypothetical protein